MTNPKRARRHLLVAVSFAVLLSPACGSEIADTSAADTSAADTSAADTAVADSTETDSTETDTAVAGIDEPSESAGGTAAGVEVGRFFDGALARPVTTTGCSLSDGTDADCHQITVVGYPVDGQIGPFCPTTTSDTADEVGIWFDGEQVYDIDGQFILELPEIYADDHWHLHDDQGNVNVTDTREAFEAAARPNVAPEYQNHCVEGRIEWLGNGEPIATSVEIPVTPSPSGATTPVGNVIGVTLNGVVIAGQAPVHAILGAYTIAAFDDCGGHVNPIDGYHIHGATGCSESGEAAADETPAFAYALDGYAIHSPLDEVQEEAADLDSCNGHITDELGYHYHASRAEKNAVLTCWTGVTVGGSSLRGRARPGG